MRNLAIGQEALLDSPFGAILASPGLHLLLLVLSALVGWLRRGYRVLVYAVPVAAYNFCTMFLLCGWDYRFFWMTTLVSIPFCLILLRGVDPGEKPE